MKPLANVSLGIDPYGGTDERIESAWHYALVTSLAVCVCDGQLLSFCQQLAAMADDRKERVSYACLMTTQLIANQLAQTRTL